VAHFAAESHVDRSILGADEFVLTTTCSAPTLSLSAVLDNPGQTFVHVSTDEVYGSVESGFCTEDHVLNPSFPLRVY
jgi:dTDP-glucose 4,6-dehydratase